MSIGGSVGLILGVIILCVVEVFTTKLLKSWKNSRLHHFLVSLMKDEVQKVISDGQLSSNVIEMTTDDWDDRTEGKYDVFMSFAYADYEHVLRVVTTLEDVHGFSCCVHTRDFQPGGKILDQIGENIEASRRVLCFLSPNFIESNYCVWEFKNALDGDIRHGKRRLATIMLQEISEFDDSNQLVQQYISKFTYLDIKDPGFEEKLLTMMPSEPIQNETTV